MAQTGVQSCQRLRDRGSRQIPMPVAKSLQSPDSLPPPSSFRRRCWPRLQWHSLRRKEMFLHRKHTATGGTAYRYQSCRNDRFPQPFLSASQGCGPKVGVVECTFRTCVESSTRLHRQFKLAGRKRLKIQRGSHCLHGFGKQKGHTREIGGNPLDQFPDGVDVRTHVRGNHDSLWPGPPACLRPPP